MATQEVNAVTRAKAKNGIDYIVYPATKAQNVSYENTASELAAENVQDAIDEQQNDFSSHANNKSNPHSVTKSQIGLGNVDNTSDANKPISAATQNALNGKANSSHSHDASDITSGTLPLARGGTGQTSLANVKNAFGITALENNFSNLINEGTIQAAENAGILSGGG